VNDANKFSVVIFVDMAVEKEERFICPQFIFWLNYENDIKI